MRTILNNMEIIDLQMMLDYDDQIKDGMDSVTKGQILLINDQPHCLIHGASLIAAETGIWKCKEPNCPNACFQTKIL